VRVTRPVEQLAEAVREVTGGNWSAYVPVTSTDEIGELADAFNRMTHELLEQRDRLVRSERVAVWRELARRLAHELKNPLFPLQLAVENLIRAREQNPQQFEEIFQESSTMLLGEIANLKQIISRFSDFSRMPQPRLQPLNLNEIAQDVARLHQAQLSASDNPSIVCKLDLAERMDPVRADPDLLHRALSNLVLNAIDAMPQGGTLTLRTHQNDSRGFIEVSDTGTGLTPEECACLFTPYYTTKSQGTGLGLAIVQSVISDHGGKITVRSQPGNGTTFVIELPRDGQKMQAAKVNDSPNGIFSGDSRAADGEFADRGR
jgi:two-component system, NtrC family, nitrogen regulation sensor histidine kinase NtrY